MDNDARERFNAQHGHKPPTLAHMVENALASFWTYASDAEIDLLDTWGELL